MSSTISTSSSPTAISSPTESAQVNNNNGPSSPLLFFVALGFGVVFTNLWIIVGVKYCFRYNQRNRARLAGEDPDGVDLNAMPRQRRRREKKLMTIDEVNEKFPLVKYKMWRATREDQGLPAAGGITNAASRPASRNGVDKLHDEVDLSENGPKTPATPTFNEKSSIVIEHGQPEQVTFTTSSASLADRPDTGKSKIVEPEAALVRVTSSDDAEEPDRIQTAIPPEQLPDPGDTCAICIDTIEEDDDIRGLSCGHAFHASCVDPWLTSRRACCPLCKADYYVPKPRPEGAAEEIRRNPEQVAQGPFSMITAGRYGNRRGQRRAFGLPGLYVDSPRPSANRPVRGGLRPSEAAEAPPEITTSEPASRSWRPRLPHIQVPALSRIRRNRGTEAGEQPTTENPDPTPAQLEAGRS